MSASPAAVSKQLAEMALAMQASRTGHTPKAVTVVASDETVVVTLHEALTPASTGPSERVASTWPAWRHARS